MAFNVIYRQVFNLTVAGAHTYYVGQGDRSLLTHNAKGCKFSSGKPPHTARVTVRRDGETVADETMTSGNMTPEETELGFPQAQLATHTEARAVRKHPLGEGDEMVIQGEYLRARRPRAR